MSDGIFLIQSGGELVRMDEAPYATEELLQNLLSNYPDLLAGEQINKAIMKLVADGVVRPERCEQNVVQRLSVTPLAGPERSPDLKSTFPDLVRASEKNGNLDQTYRRSKFTGN
jgi:hypothetical protein